MRGKRFFKRNCEIWERMGSLGGLEDDVVFCVRKKVTKVCCDALNDYADGIPSGVLGDRFYVSRGVGGTHVIRERTGKYEFDEPRAVCESANYASVCAAALNADYLK